VAPTHDHVLGVLSLVFWALVIVISIKYLVFVLRADNEGEGGILALTALATLIRPTGRQERAALVLHNATASDVGAIVDSLDLQVAALQAQVAALQASFDALNSNITNITDRLNLSLENETINLARIADLQANLTALRYVVENATHNETVSVDALASTRRDFDNLTANFTAVSYNLSLALQNASVLAGRLNLTLDELDLSKTALTNANATADQRAKEAASAESRTAAAAAVGIVVGLAAMFFLQWLGIFPKTRAPRPPEAKGKDEKDAKARDEK